MLDSTGLSIVGAGEWAAAKHGGCGRRGWRKLHLGVDQSGVIRVHTLTEATGEDATTALDLLNAVDGHLVSVIADAAYDTVALYETARARGGRSSSHRPGRRRGRGGPDCALDTWVRRSSRLPFLSWQSSQVSDC